MNPRFLLPLTLVLLAAVPAPTREGLRRAALERNIRPPAAASQPAPAPFNGRDLAAASVTTHIDTLPDIFHPVPAGSHSFEVRPDVTLIPATYPHGVLQPGTPTIYWRKDLKIFYLQSDGLGSSTHHFYGPFDGDPTVPLATTQPAGAPASQPASH